MFSTPGPPGMSLEVGGTVHVCVCAYVWERHGFCPCEGIYIERERVVEGSSGIWADRGELVHDVFKGQSFLETHSGQWKAGDVGKFVFLRTHK